MSDPFDFLKQQAQEEQAKAALAEGIKAWTAMRDTMIAAGFSKEFAEQMILIFMRGALPGGK